MNISFEVDHESDEVAILFDDSISLSVEKLDGETFRCAGFPKLADELNDDELVEKIRKFAKDLLST